MLKYPLIDRIGLKIELLGANLCLAHFVSSAFTATADIFSESLPIKISLLSVNFQLKGTKLGVFEGAESFKTTYGTYDV